MICSLGPDESALSCRCNHLTGKSHAESVIINYHGWKWAETKKQNWRWWWKDGSDVGRKRRKWQRGWARHNSSRLYETFDNIVSSLTHPSFPLARPSLTEPTVGVTMSRVLFLNYHDDLRENRDPVFTSTQQKHWYAVSIRADGDCDLYDPRKHAYRLLRPKTPNGLSLRTPWIKIQK
jgi:hypothetical protein